MVQVKSLLAILCAQLFKKIYINRKAIHILLLQTYTFYGALAPQQIMVQ